VSTQIIWAAALPFVKTSILLLYIRIFGRLRYMRIMAWVVGVINFAYGFTVMLVCALQCVPLQSLWDMTITDKRCINSGLFFILGSIPDFVTDLIILLLPLPAIWQLHTSTAQKAGITGVFALGSFTFVVSIIRFAELCVHGTNPDVTWALGNLGIWSTVEICVGIIAACLPTTWPLIVRVFPRLANGTSRMHARPTPYNDASDASGLKLNKKKIRSEYSYAMETTNDYTRMSDEEEQHRSLALSTVKNNISSPQLSAWDTTAPKNGIRVETTVSSLSAPREARR